MALREEVMRELKTYRDIVYQKEKEMSGFVTALQEKNEADLAYVAMMSGVELDEETEADDNAQ